MRITYVSHERSVEKLVDQIQEDERWSHVFRTFELLLKHLPSILQVFLLQKRLRLYNVPLTAIH